MRAILLHILVDLLLSLAMLAAHSDGGEVTDPRLASFRVVVPEAGGTSNGSGTAIAPDVVITNSHVVGHRLAACLVRAPHGGPDYRGRVVYGDRAADIALVVIEGGRLDYVALGSDPAPGDHLLSCGYGRTGVLAAGGGVRTALVYGDPSGDGTQFFTSTIRIEPGDSGSGVFDDRGRLVGVNWGAGVAQEAHFTPISRVRRVVAGAADRLTAATAALLGCENGRCPPTQSRPPSSGGRSLVPVRPKPRVPDIDEVPPEAPLPDEGWKTKPDAAPAPPPPAPDMSRYATKEDLAAAEARIAAKIPPPLDTTPWATTTDVGAALSRRDELIARLREDMAMVPEKIAAAQAAGAEGAAALAVAAARGILDERISRAGGPISYAVAVAALCGVSVPGGMLGWAALRMLAGRRARHSAPPAPPPPPPPAPPPPAGPGGAGNEPFR